MSAGVRWAVAAAAPALVAAGGRIRARPSMLLHALCAGVIEMTKGRSTRALYGACACTAQLAGLRRSGGGGGDEDGADVARLAAEALQQQYALHCPDKLPLVRGMLKAQGLL